MAKNKKKSQPQQKAGLSQTEYMRKVMRKLPIEQCYVNTNWREEGMAHVMVVRRRPDDRFAMVSYLVDTFCLGVKDAMWNTRMEKSEIDALVEHYTEVIDFAMCDYATVHNLVLGAVEFAEEAGIKPCPEWAIGQYGLDEDSDDIELIEFDYGIMGKHFLNTATKAEGVKYLPILEKTLGKGNFSYHFEDQPFSSPLMPEEEYAAPAGVEYPETLELVNPIVGEILLNDDYVYAVPVDEMARIAALDRDSLIADLNRLAMYIIGQDNGEDEVTDEAMLHIVVILNTLADPRGLDTLLSMLRMSPDQLDVYFGDAAPNIFSSALARCGIDRLPDLEAFLNEPGRTCYNRSFVLSALELIAEDRRDEVVDIIKRQLETLPDRVPGLKTADYDYAGFVCSTASNIGDRSLIPLVEDLYEKELVNPDICGSLDMALEDWNTFHGEKYMTMSEIYQWIKNISRPVSNPETDYEKLWTK